jgi:hypothetical protein
VFLISLIAEFQQACEYHSEQLSHVPVADGCA